MNWCDYCSQSPAPLRGILFPTDFDDREPSRDGKIFVALCADCYSATLSQGYGNDTDAADAVKRVSGWLWRKSYDRDDALDPAERAAAVGKDYYRPYFTVTLAGAEALMGRSPPTGSGSSHGRRAQQDRCECGAFAIGCGKRQPGHSSWCPWL